METMSTSLQRTPLHLHPIDDDDYVMHSFSVFALHNGNDSAKEDKYFTWLPVSISPKKTIKVLMQVD